MATAMYALCLLIYNAAVQELHTTDGRGNDKALLKTVMINASLDRLQAGKTT